MISGTKGKRMQDLGGGGSVKRGSASGKRVERTCERWTDGQWKEEREQGHKRCVPDKTREASTGRATWGFLKHTKRFGFIPGNGTNTTESSEEQKG